MKKKQNKIKQHEKHRSGGRRHSHAGKKRRG